MLELRHLTYFRTVAEFGSIAKAAAALGMTQPTLSRQIAQLERGLGYNLLHRTARGTTLTSAGEGLREVAAAVFNQLDQVPAILESSSQGKQLLNIGLPPALPRTWFEAFVGEIRKTLPRVALSLHEATSEQQRSLLQRGVLDIGLMHSEPPEFASRPVIDQRLGCAFPDAGKFNGRPSLSFLDLDGLKVMAHSSKETAGHEMMLRAAANANAIRVDWTFRSFSEHSQLIAQTMGVDAVVVSEESANWRFPSWQWTPLDFGPENPSMTTWAVWANRHLDGLDRCLEAMKLATTRIEDVGHP